MQRVELEVKLEAVRKGIPYKELAAKVGVSEDRLYKAFSDPTRHLSTSELVRASKILGVPASELMRRAEEYDTRQGGDAA